MRGCLQVLAGIVAFFLHFDGGGGGDGAAIAGNCDEP